MRAWAVAALVAACGVSAAAQQPGGEERVSIEALIARLGDPAWSVREEATTALIRLGVPGLPALGRACEATDPEVAHRARYVRGTILARLEEAAYAKRFWVLGPFAIESPVAGRGLENRAQAGFLELPYPPDSEPALRSDAEYPAAGTPAARTRWKLLVSKSPRWFDLHETLQGGESIDYRIAYVMTFVRADREKTVTLHLGSDDGIAVWVNGKLVHVHDCIRLMDPAERDQEQATATLRPGWNPVVIKQSHRFEQWALALRISDEDGVPLPAEDVDPTRGGEAAEAWTIEGALEAITPPEGEPKDR